VNDDLRGIWLVFTEFASVARDASILTIAVIGYD
jgi:hypothetical protein